MAMDSESRPLEIFFLPFFAPSHLIAVSETARLFASRGQNVTLITTPSNASYVRSTFDRDTTSGHRMSLHILPFPAKECGLPDGLENLSAANDMETWIKLEQGFDLLRPKMEEFIVSRRPDCIVADLCYPWTVDLAARLGIPRLHFYITSVFSFCVEWAAQQPDSPHWKVQSDYEPFTFSGLPDPISMTRSMLPDCIRDPNGPSAQTMDEDKKAKLKKTMNEGKKAELKSYGVLVNSFYELESKYTDYYQKLTPAKIINIGPVGLINRNIGDKSGRLYKTVVGENEFSSWLSSRESKSVLYISFGSLSKVSNEQLMEMASGLEDSGHPFIWVVQGKGEDEEENWLPKGFRERTLERGMIVKGWAPQLLILDHPSVGGFMTQCGWNSVTEAISAGVPMITWPLTFEQFYNEKLVTQVLRVGVEVGTQDWHLINDGENPRVIKGELIKNAVKRLLNGGNDTMEIRQRSKELKEKAKKATEEGGSSYNKLTNLIGELHLLRGDPARLGSGHPKLS